MNRLAWSLSIVSFYACGLKWSICFLQSRRGSQGWQFFFLSRRVSHGRKGGVLLDLCQLFPSIHDYYFLPCMWPQVIDLFSSKQAGIAGMVVSFSIARGIAWPEGMSLAWSLPIVFFHAWLLFPSMHVASGDRFVSFQASGGRRDDSFFFYRAVHDYCFLPCMWPQVIDKAGGDRRRGQTDEPKQMSHQKYPHFILFSCRRNNKYIFEPLTFL